MILRLNFFLESLEPTTVYISYFADTEKKEERVLYLAAALSQFGIKCTLDLLCQVDINNNGGLPIWLPENVTNSDKILVVITRDYLEVGTLLYLIVVLF